jgi:uncharacterized protein YbjT (DUF2867 family)
MNVLVIGGTGVVGRELVRQLAASRAARSIRVLTRNPEHARTTLAHVASRVELVAGDLAAPPTLASAFDGMDKAFVLANGIELAHLESNAFDAAKAARVHHVVKGPERLTYAGMFAKMSRAIGTELRHVDCTNDEARTAMLDAGVPAAFADSVPSHFEGVRTGKMRMTSALADLLGRRPRTFDDWLGSLPRQVTKR